MVREEQCVVYKCVDVLQKQKLAVVQERTVAQSYADLHPHHEAVFPATRERLQLRFETGFEREKAQKTVVNVRRDRFVVPTMCCAYQTAVYERLVVEVVLCQRTEDRTIGIYFDVAIAELLVDIAVEKTLSFDTPPPYLQSGTLR